MKIQTKGKVIIAGAGPGDPELITIKAVRCLQQADVVLTDRLVSEEILLTYVSPKAEIIFVGKEGRKTNHSVKQKEINQLMINEALQGKNVVRLKGGDVAFFSNVLDELNALIEHNISYEIIPGITAASGASAYAGIPLTARGNARGTRILTYSSSDNFKEEEWKNMATTSDTLVFYMCGNNWISIAKNLLKYNIDRSKKIALIQQATTPFQQVHIYDFDEIINSKINDDFVSPSIVIIGNVVELYKKFAWRKNSELKENYFDSVTRKNLYQHKEELLSI